MTLIRKKTFKMIQLQHVKNEPGCKAPNRWLSMVSGIALDISI